MAERGEGTHAACQQEIEELRQVNATLHAEVIYLRQSFDALTAGVTTFVNEWRERVLSRPIPGDAVPASSVPSAPLAE